MMLRSVLVALLCVFLVGLVAAADEGGLPPKVLFTPPNEPLLNISGFAWAENLFFDGKGNLFVSDMLTGVLWRIYFDDYLGVYQVVHFADSDAFAGLAAWTVTNANASSVPPAFPIPTLFAAASYGENGNATLVAFNSSSMEGDSMVSIVASLSDMGNGLALWAPNNDFNRLTVFVALSYQFVANQSMLVRVNVSTGEVTTVFEGLSGADGVEIWCPTPDQAAGCLLYFNEVISGSTFFVYDIDTGVILTQFVPPPPAYLVDDFCLSADGQTIYAADFGTGAVLSFASDGSSTNSTVLATGFKNPTAVRIGSGIGFRTTSLYVSEGGGKEASETDRRVVEIPHVIHP